MVSDGQRWCWYYPSTGQIAGKYSQTEILSKKSQLRKRFCVLKGVNLSNGVCWVKKLWFTFVQGKMNPTFQSEVPGRNHSRQQHSGVILPEERTTPECPLPDHDFQVRITPARGYQKISEHQNIFYYFLRLLIQEGEY